MPITMGIARASSCLSSSSSSSDCSDNNNSESVAAIVTGVEVFIDGYRWFAASIDFSKIERELKLRMLLNNDDHAEVNHDQHVVDVDMMAFIDENLLEYPWVFEFEIDIDKNGNGDSDTDNARVMHNMDIKSRAVDDNGNLEDAQNVKPFVSVDINRQLFPCHRRSGHDSVVTPSPSADAERTWQWRPRTKLVNTHPTNA